MDEIKFQFYTALVLGHILGWIMGFLSLYVYNSLSKSDAFSSHPVNKYLLSLSGNSFDPRILDGMSREETYKLWKGSQLTQFSALKAIMAVELGGKRLSDATEAESAEYAEAVYFFEWSKLDYDRVSSIQTELLARYSPAYVQRVMSALRGVLNQCEALGLIDHREKEYILAPLKPVKLEKGKKVGRILQQGEIDRLMDVCRKDRSPAGVRDAAVLGLWRSTGPRIAEMAKLRYEDVIPDEHGGRPIFKVWYQKAKGFKTRSAHINGGAYVAMKEWLEIRGDRPGALFTPINQLGEIKIQDRPMATNSIRDILTKRMEAAGLQPFTSHDLRRTFGSLAHRKGIPLKTVSEMMGHASTQTTERYLRVTEDEKAEGFMSMSFDYEGHSAGLDESDEIKDVELPF